MYTLKFYMSSFDCKIDRFQSTIIKSVCTFSKNGIKLHSTLKKLKRKF